MHDLTRRGFTASAFGALAAGGVAGCTSGMPGAASASSPMPSIAPVRMGDDRITNTLVGLRPFRPSGFRVAAEMLGEKRLIHNYGHGGGGITLSWGTAHLAVEQGYDPQVAEYAVIGAGVVGLSTAMLLVERGAKVTIYARDLTPNTTSVIAGGQWWPASVYRRGALAPGYMDQQLAAMRYAFKRYQSLVGPDYGVRWETNYIFSDRPITKRPAPEDSPMREFVINQRDYAPGELPFNSPHVRSFDTLMIDSPYYLRVLERDVLLHGVKIIVKDFKDAAELQALPQSVIFNCAGLGAGALFGDTEIQPARGQLVVLQPQSEIDYNYISGGPAYMFSRRDGIVLGGTFQQGNWSLAPSAEDTATILAANRALFSTMDSA